MPHERIKLLDSFRALAILAVMFYHFTFRWNQFLPSGKFYGHFAEFGWVGVQFFFIISGFVISYTLGNTSTPKRFFTNRFIRLFPPLLLCSLITFTVVRLFDNAPLFPQAHQPADLLPSLTLISPEVLNHFTASGHAFSWIDGSYWSLWVEIQFYVIAAVLYFAGKANFTRHLLWAAIVVSSMTYLRTALIHLPWGVKSHPALASLVDKTGEMMHMFDVVYYINWFALGAFCHYLYKGYRLLSRKGIDVAFLIMMVFFVGDHFRSRSEFPWIMYLVLFGLFGLLIFKSQWLSFLNRPVLQRLGVISYTVYLIHENCGVLLMSKVGPYVNWSPLLPLATMGLAILFAELSWRTYERYVHRWLKILAPGRPEQQVPAPAEKEVPAPAEQESLAPAEQEALAPVTAVTPDSNWKVYAALSQPEADSTVPRAPIRREIQKPG